MSFFLENVTTQRVFEEMMRLVVCVKTGDIFCTNIMFTVNNTVLVPIMTRKSFSILHVGNHLTSTKQREP